MIGFISCGLPMEVSAAQPSPGISTPLIAINLHAGNESLWDYSVAALPAAHAIAAPVVNLEGRDVPLHWEKVDSVEPARSLANGCIERAFEGSVLGEPGLRLRVVFRTADDDPVVRFHYEIRSDRERRLTKPAGVDRLAYFGLSLSEHSNVSDLHLSEFNELFHSYMPVEHPLDERSFSHAEAAMGPVLLSQDGQEQLLLAYEHGSAVPDAYLHFKLSKDRHVVLEAVKGNYWNGEEVGPREPFTSIWFEIGAVAGDRQLLQKTYRDFILRHLAISPASRRPWIFYNTWNYQERLKHWQGKPYLAEMNLARMLAEIDVAHRMGIEVFVIDTGWFQKAGDWEPNLQRFPDGLSQIRERLRANGMKLGLWFAPSKAAVTSQIGKSHADCLQILDGVRQTPRPVWETEEAVGYCLVSRYGEDFADTLIRLNRELGVTYFKWDSIGQYSCSEPGHGQGTAANSETERLDCHAFQLPLAIARIAEKVSAAVPDAICDFDVTENNRAVGLAFLSAGKYFLANNGPYLSSYNRPLPPDNNPNLFFYPGPARDWILRTPLAYDSWIPSVLFLAHYLPDEPHDSQLVSLASLVLGQNGVWGDLPGVSPAGVALFHEVLTRYKEVRDDITRAFPLVSGPVGGTPEIHEKIAENGRGVVALFSPPGTYRYITEHAVDRHVWHTDGVAVAFDEAGRAVITATITSHASAPPRDGAQLVFFGVSGN